MSIFVMLENNDDDVILTIAEQKPDFSTEHLSQHRIPKLHVTSFDKLDGELSRIGYRRIGDWKKIPHGGIADVEPIASTTETPVKEAPGRRGDHGILVDVESGERLGPATAWQLKYASRTADTTLRIDAKGQPYAKGSTPWLQKNTRHVQIREIPPGALERAMESKSEARARALRNGKLLATTSASIGNAAWEAMRRKDLVNGRLMVIDADGQRTLVFSPDSGDIIDFSESEIIDVTKVASGFNSIVNLVYGNPLAHMEVLCLVGPRGRMKTIFATLGHPI